MTIEELESFDELNTDLHDIDELDMGLEIISHHIRKNIQEFAEIILKQQSELQTYKNKEDKLRKLLGNYKHYSSPTEKQLYENEDIVDNALKILNGSDK